MSPELMAILLGIAYSICSTFVFVIVLRRFRGEVYDFGNSIMEGFMEVFANPAMKTTMSMIGQKGGEMKADRTLTDQMALDVLDSPQFAAIRMGAQGFGLDIDGYIEQHGAIKTLRNAKALGDQLGIDIMNIDISSLAGGLGVGGQSPPSGPNPYRGR